MKYKIQHSFRRDGFDSTLIKSAALSPDKKGKERHVALYERTKAGTKHREVCIVRFKDVRHIKGREISAGFVLPSPEAWGRLGWTYTQLSDSEDRFESVVRS